MSCPDPYGRNCRAGPAPARLWPCLRRPSPPDCGSAASPSPTDRSAPSAASTWTSAPGRPSRCSGPNGAGKSTTIDMLLGLTRPDAGNGQRLRPRPGAAVAGRQGRRDAAGRRAARRADRARAGRLSAALYPAPMPVDEVLARAGPRRPGRAARRPSCPAARPSGCGSRSRWCPTPSCWCWTSRPRRWTWRSGGRSGHRCASTRGRADGPVRHPLPGGGGRSSPTGSCDGRGRVVADGPADARSRPPSAAARSGPPLGASRRPGCEALPGVTGRAARRTRSR